MKALLLWAVLSLAFVGKSQEVKITNFIPTGFVRSIAVEEDTLWIGTNSSGLYKTLKDGTLLSHYSIEDGLVNNYIENISIDKDGNKWIGTSNGLCKFDGVNWTKYPEIENLECNTIRSQAIDENGNIWFANWCALYRFDGGNLTEYKINDEEGYSYSIALAIDLDNNIWVGSAMNGLYKFNGENWTAFENISTSELEIDKKGNIWVISGESEIKSYNGTEWTTYGTSDSISIRELGILSMTADSNGNMWFGTSTKGIYKYDGAAWTLQPKNNLTKNGVGFLTSDTDGNIWVGSKYGYYAQLNNNEWNNFNIKGLASDGIESIAIDENGNKWLAADWDGLIMFNDSASTIYYETETGIYRANEVFIDNDKNIWVGDFYGLKYYDGCRWNQHSIYGGVNNIFSDLDGNIWATGGEDGPVVFDGVQFSDATTEPFYYESLSDLYFDTKGNIWSFNDDRLRMYNGQKWIDYYIPSDIPSLYPPLSIDINGNVWAGTGATGIVKFDGENWTKYDKSNGLVGNYVISITSDISGNIWIGTTSGLSMFDGNSWVNYTTENGLFGDFIGSITIDNDGAKWIGTRTCLTKLEDGGSKGFKATETNIGGILFYDRNRNRIQDADEQLLPKQLLQLLPDSAIIGNFDGSFSFQRKDGSYSLKALPLENWECTTAKSIDFTIKNGKTETALTFGLAPIEDKTELSADILGQATRANFNTRYWLNIENEGKESGTVTVKMQHSNLLTYTSASIEPTSNTGNTLEWLIDDIGVFENKQIVVDFTVAGVEHLGDTIVNILSASSAKEDAEPANNTASLSQVITGSYDPNDKQESKGILEKGYTLFDEELFYTIRFQNTGTDTAFNISIKDTLDAKLQLNTFRLQSSSHNSTFDLTGEGVLTFKFKNIMLPDSNVNEPASHGYVKYRIKPAGGMDENTEVNNTASIYFDFNPAIVTNTTINTFVSELPKDDKPIVTSIENSRTSSLFPNPANRYIKIRASVSSTDYQIIDLTGRITQTGKTADNAINISQLAKGLYILEIEGEQVPFIKE